MNTSFWIALGVIFGGMFITFLAFVINTAICALWFTLFCGVCKLLGVVTIGSWVVAFNWLVPIIGGLFFTFWKIFVKK